MWKVTFEDLEPVDLDGRIWVIGFVRVAGQKPVLDALYNDASDVAYRVCVFKSSENGRGTGEVRSRVQCTAGRYQS
jgi:hypothetical protein